MLHTVIMPPNSNSAIFCAPQNNSAPNSNSSLFRAPHSNSVLLSALHGYNTPTQQHGFLSAHKLIMLLLWSLNINASLEVMFFDLTQLHWRITMPDHQTYVNPALLRI